LEAQNTLRQWLEDHSKAVVAAIFIVLLIVGVFV
jgi:hypothetical protein